jgi:hypothetical protein
MERRDADPGINQASQRVVKRDSVVSVHPASASADPKTGVSTDRTIPGPVQQAYAINVKVGVAIIVTFFGALPIVTLVITFANTLPKHPLLRS